MTTNRLLLVDDDLSIRLVAQAGLEHTGVWQVSTASSGPEGLEMAEAEQPDVILLDVMMPQMDGPTTFAHLRANTLTCDIPVIFLTATSPSTVTPPWEGLPIVGVLAKPFDPVALSDQILDALGWPT